jgi:hypothetical protein
MNLPRWSSVILTMGLAITLIPLSAQAWPHQPNVRQPNSRAFTPQQPRGNAFGWHGQQRQWRQPRGNAVGWHGQRHQWRQPRHSFAQRYRPGYRQFQPPNQGQYQNRRFPYDRAGYPGQTQAPDFTSRTRTYPNNPSGQVGQPYSQSGFHRSGAYGNSSRSQAQTSSSSSQVSD